MSKLIIEPNQLSLGKKLRELFQYKELLYTLTYRDFRVRYAQTAIGFTWALINPLVTLLLLTFVFGTVAKIDTNGIPHALFTIAGMCGWTYFAAVFSQAGNSIIGAQNMIKKIYFPRLVIPLSKALTALIDFAIVLLCLGVLMIYYQYPPSGTMVWLPFFIFMTLITGLTAGIWMSALTTRYRDFQHIIPFLLRIGLFVTPIAFPISTVPEQYRLLFYLNPMVGIVEGFRWSILGVGSLEIYVWISFFLIIVLFFAGLYYFHKVEQIMADIL